MPSRHEESDPRTLFFEGTRRALILHLHYYHLSLTGILERSCQDFRSINPSEWRCCFPLGLTSESITRAPGKCGQRHCFDPNFEWLGQAVEDEYNCPAKAPAGWWGDLPVSRIFVGAGGEKGLSDPIREMAEKMKVRRLHKIYFFPNSLSSAALALCHENSTLNQSRTSL